MKTKNGYLIIEASLSICISLIIIIGLYGLLFSSLKIYKKIHSSIEIQQQGIEIQKHIEKELSEGIEVVNVKTQNNQILTSKNFEFKNVISIKYKPIDRLSSMGLDELFLNKKTQKIFIKRRNSASGYEIGDYLDNMYISKEKDGELIRIKLELSKNKQLNTVEFTMYNRYISMGENI